MEGNGTCQASCCSRCVESLASGAFLTFDYSVFFVAESPQERDRPTVPGEIYRRKCYKCLRALSKCHDIVPSQLYLPSADLAKDNNVRLTGGNFSVSVVMCQVYRVMILIDGVQDIYRGKFKGQPACFKVLRIAAEGDFSAEGVIKV